MLTLKRFCLIALVLLHSPVVTAGDAQARVDTMLRHLGGREVWASARSVFTMERARYPVYGDGIVATHWLDLDAPGEKVRISGERVDIEWGWDMEGGWIRRDEDVQAFDASDLAERRQAWRHDIFLLLRRLAENDEKLKVTPLSPNGILLRDADGELLAEFHLTREGELYLWKKFGAREVTLIFGSHRSFGDISFPDWGTAASGDWSAYFTQIHASPKSFAKNVSLKRPGSEWQGGALHSGSCERR